MLPVEEEGGDGTDDAVVFAEVRDVLDVAAAVIFVETAEDAPTCAEPPVVSWWDAALVVSFILLSVSPLCAGTLPQEAASRPIASARHPQRMAPCRMMVPSLLQ